MVTSYKIYLETVHFEQLSLAGGEGSILGAGASVIGIGSDIGGSIRIPCFFNGIFGHKPSLGKKIVCECLWHYETTIKIMLLCYVICMEDCEIL